MGVGTNAPSGKVYIQGTETALTGSHLIIQGTGTAGFAFADYSGTNTYSAIYPSGIAPSSRSFTNYLLISDLNGTDVGVNSQTQLNLKTSGSNRLSAFSSGIAVPNGLSVGQTSVNSDAKVYIKGSGSTSATTSLLVQNSGGTNLLQVTDDGNTSFTTASGGIVQIGNSTTSIFRIVNTYQRISIAPISVGGSISLTAGTEAGASYTANDSGHVFAYPNNRTTANTFSINREFFGNVVATTKTMLNITTSNATVLSNATLLRGVYFAPTTTDWPEIRAFESTSGGAYINTSSVSASAILQADSTTKGFLPPRMTTTQKNAIASPAAGLVVYDNTTNKLQCYNGSTWNDLF